MGIQKKSGKRSRFFNVISGELAIFDLIEASPIAQGAVVAFV